MNFTFSPDIFMVIIAILVTIIIISTISILSRSKHHKKIDRFESRIDILSDELGRQKQDNSHLRNDLKRINLEDNLFFASMIRLTSNYDPSEIYNETAKFLVEYLKAEEIAVFHFDEQSKRLNIRVQYGLDEDWLPKLLYNLGEGKVGVAAEKRRPCGRRETEWWQIHEPYPIFEPDLCYPINFLDKLFGVIAISRSDDFEERERSVLGVVSQITGVALKNTKDLQMFQSLANTDPMTKLYNIGYFKDRLHEALNNVQKLQGELCVTIIDLDRFKHYNDTYGHQAGDRLLISLSRVFAQYFPKLAILARYGGDEFIFMHPKIKKQVVADKINRLLQDLSTRDIVSEHKGIKVSFSAGVSSYPEDGTTMTQLMKSADEALYAAKGAGRNTVQIHGHKEAKK